MKVVILAGGLGTRISEESQLRPKPMIEIGDMPILWHIMKIYSYYGYNDFIICCGYKGYVIKEYFANYFLHTSDITFDFSNNNKITVHNNVTEPWKVTLVDTGNESMTGKRIKLIKSYIEKNEEFMLTYGDGVSDINILKLMEYHIQHKKLATVTSVQPIGRFGALNIDEKNTVKNFEEKPKGDNSWINGGFFVLNYKVFDYIPDGNVIFEKEPLEKLAEDNQLIAYKHNGFWQLMDTMRDKNYLEQLWYSKNAPWKVWN